MLVIENCNSLSDLRQKLIDGEEVRTAVGKIEPVIRDNGVKDELKPTTKNDLALIHTEGLDEEIRCTMCTNSMKSDRGCDGGCVVNNAMYKKVMDAMERRIQPITKNDLGVDAVNRKELLKIYEDRFWELQKLKHLKDNKGAEDRQMGVNYCINILKKMPPVTPQPKIGHWIPVSEELPDKEGYYLCSVRYMYPPYNFFEPEKVKYMDDVTIQKFDGEFNIEVKAWMPLPESYIAESEV